MVTPGTSASVEPHADELRDPRRLLRDAVEGLRDSHRPLVVRDEDELRLLGQLHEERREAVDVRLVERGVDLVEDAERRRLVPVSYTHLTLLTNREVESSVV